MSDSADAIREHGRKVLDEVLAHDSGLLTEPEHRAIALTADLWNTLVGVVGDGPTRDADLRELCDKVHQIQQTILSQAAARAYPELYRLLGGTVA